MTATPPAGSQPLALLALVWLGLPGVAAGELEAPSGRETSPPPKLSPHIREAVARSLPKYSPPKPQPPHAMTPPPDDDVLVLPTIRVAPNRPPLDPFAVLSHEARAELARRQNSGLGLGPLSRLNQDLGVEIMTEEREYAKRSTLKNEVDHLAKLDPAGFAEATKLIRDATAQPNRDWATSTGLNRNPTAVTIRPPPYPDKKRR